MCVFFASVCARTPVAVRSQHWEGKFFVERASSKFFEKGVKRKSALGACLMGGEGGTPESVDVEIFSVLFFCVRVCSYTSSCATKALRGKVVREEASNKFPEKGVKRKSALGACLMGGGGRNS